jgi:prepilin-type N-terminal cleavage/methylation domain-containing protein
MTFCIGRRRFIYASLDHSEWSRSWHVSQIGRIPSRSVVKHRAGPEGACYELGEKPVLQRSMEKKRSGQGGFTLVELLVVIAILGILAAIVVFAVGGIGDKGKAAAESTSCSVVQTAEEAYYANTGGYATGAAARVSCTRPVRASASRPRRGRMWATRSSARPATVRRDSRNRMIRGPLRWAPNLFQALVSSSVPLFRFTSGPRVPPECVVSPR